MNQRPILFSAPMVRAIQAGSKSQTRRVIGFTGYSKDDPPTDICSGTYLGDSQWKFTDQTNGVGNYAYAKCPYGVVGDVLWVRESYYAYGKWEQRFNEKKQRTEWYFVDLTLERKFNYSYEEEPPQQLQTKRTQGIEGYWKRPSIFMPYVAARLFIKITRIRVEPLQAISQDDAIAEGIAQSASCMGYKTWLNYTQKESQPTSFLDPVNSYHSLWELINGVDSWPTNPWVWVVEFECIEKPV